MSDGIDWIDTMRAWARGSGPQHATPDGRLPDGPMQKVLGADRVVMLTVDSNGRVFQLLGTFSIHGARYQQIYPGRSELEKLMDLFDVRDLPKPPPPGDDA